jgi:hypothetical protein
MDWVHRGHQYANPVQAAHDCRVAYTWASRESRTAEDGSTRKWELEKERNRLSEIYSDLKRQ